MHTTQQTTSVFLITGPVQGGKSTYLSQLISILKKMPWKVEGILCPGSVNAGKRSGFTLKNIRNGKEVVMATLQEHSGWLAFGRFWFDPEAFKLGSAWIREATSYKPDVVIIDEVGPMELVGKGWSESLQYLLGASVPVQIWSVREKVLAEVIKRWNIAPGNVLRMEEVGVSKASEQIIRALEEYRKK